MRSSTVITALLLPAFSLAATKPKAPSKDAILLSTVKTLTLYKNRQTSHRRVSAVPQIFCSGGTAKDLFEPDVIRCSNQGYDYDPESIQWTCTASLPPEFKLGSTEVICEGYRSSNDDFVLKGSCGVEYRLELTEMGEERYPDRVKGSGSWWGGSQPNTRVYGGDQSGESSLPAVLFWCIFVSIAGWIVFAAFIRNSTWWRGGARPLGGAGTRRPPGGGGGGGGGGGWYPGNDDDDAPPPYSRHDRPAKSSTPNANTDGRRWQPGFWTGAASGAAASYIANNLSGRNNTNQANRGYDAGVGPSGAGPARTAPRSSSTFSSTPSHSSTRYESSGFGGTSRR